MSTAAKPIVDTLSAITPAETQRAAAQLAQDVFAEVFRQSCAVDQAKIGKSLSEMESRCIQWCEAGETSENQLLRLAMLISGLDQWGLAYTQTFNLKAIAPLSALISFLRTRLNPQAEALFQQFFEMIEQGETNAVDFKVELRRSLHVALWHAMAACETLAEAEVILQTLGGMLLALDQQMPEIGWRLMADALAHIQIGLLKADNDIAREGTQMLFLSLRQAMPAERYQGIQRHASQVVIAWQQAQRSSQQIQ